MAINKPKVDDQPWSPERLAQAEYGNPSKLNEGNDNERFRRPPGKPTSRRARMAVQTNYSGWTTETMEDNK